MEKFTNEEIEKIEFWLARLYPKRMHFIFFDEYVNTLTEEYYKTWTIDHHRSEANPIELFLIQRGFIEKETKNNQTTNYFTRYGIEVYEAGGWNQYVSFKEKEKEQKLKDDELARQVNRSVKRLSAIQIWATIVTLGIIAANLFVDYSVLSINEKRQFEKQQFQELQDSLIKLGQQLKQYQAYPPGGQNQKISDPKSDTLPKPKISIKK